MRTLVDQQVTPQGYRISKFQDEKGNVSGNVQYLADAEIISINDTTPAGTNSNGNAFFVANVKITEKGKEQTGTAIIWENQLKSPKLPEGTWAPGAPISVAINAVGEHKGKASVELRGGGQVGFKDNALPEMDADTMKAMEAMGLGELKISA